MTRTQRLLVTLPIGIALAKVLEILFGYAAALPMPWLRVVGEHGATSFLVLLTFGVGLVSAYVVGRVLFRYVGTDLLQVTACALPWVAWSIYIDYIGIETWRASSSGFNPAISLWLFLLGIAASLLSVPAGLWLASRTQRN